MRTILADSVPSGGIIGTLIVTIGAVVVAAFAARRPAAREAADQANANDAAGMWKQAFEQLHDAQEERDSMNREREAAVARAVDAETKLAAVTTELQRCEKERLELYRRVNRGKS